MGMIAGNGQWPVRLTLALVLAFVNQVGQSVQLLNDGQMRE